MSNIINPYRFAAVNRTLIQIITDLSLTTNLKLCLDAGDSASYSSGQKWLDTSGGGYDFFRGADGGSSTDDPTFNGSAGGLSSAEFWSSDGGDFFTYDTTIEAWMDNLHQDGATFTVFAVGTPDADASSYMFASESGGTQTGFSFVIQLDGDLNFRIRNGSSTEAEKTTDAGDALSVGNLHGVALSINENGGDVSFFWADGAPMQVGSSNTFDAVYTSPSAGSAAFTPTLMGANGGGPNGTQLACVAIWEGTVLTDANLDSIWTALNGERAYV